MEMLDALQRRSTTSPPIRHHVVVIAANGRVCPGTIWKEMLAIAPASSVRCSTVLQRDDTHAHAAAVIARVHASPPPPAASCRRLRSRSGVDGPALRHVG